MLHPSMMVHIVTVQFLPHEKGSLIFTRTPVLVLYIVALMLRPSKVFGPEKDYFLEADVQNDNVVSQWSVTLLKHM